jgi:ABC-type cobalamin/Fe3+-siderophores transport system ATPase subunit
MPFDARLHTPFNSIIVGPSQSGKTTLLHRLLRHSELVLSHKPKYVLLFYKYEQSVYNTMVHEGLIQEKLQINESGVDFDFIVNKVAPYKSSNGSMVIFDDSLSDLPKHFDQVFTSLSHHNNCSIILLTQMLFRNDEAYKSLSRNCHYFFIMRNERDKRAISTLAQQSCPGNKDYIVASFTDATREPYSYLMVDFSQKSPTELKLRSNIFPEEFPYVVYVP